MVGKQGEDGARQRQKKGEGTFIERDDRGPEHRIEHRFTFDRKRYSVYGRTERECKKKRRETERDLEQAVVPAGGSVLLKTYLPNWLKGKRNLQQDTASDYRDKMELYILPTLGAISLRTLTADHIEGLYNELLRRGYAARTVRKVHTILRSALQAALRKRLRSFNPADAVELPRVERFEGQTLTAVDAGRLLETAKSNRLEALYVLALGTGMRQAEMLGLQWDAVDLGRRLLHVRTTLHTRASKGGKWRIEGPKSKRSRRTIELTPEVGTALTEQWERQQDVRTLAGERWEDHGLVFTTKWGTPLYRSNLDNYFRRLMAKTEIVAPGFRFHDLRHTAGSLMLEAGLSLHEIAEILGHSTISTTSDIYVHTTSESRRRGLERLGDLLYGRSVGR